MASSRSCGKGSTPPARPKLLESAPLPLLALRLPPWLSPSHPAPSSVLSSQRLPIPPTLTSRTSSLETRLPNRSRTSPWDSSPSGPSPPSLPRPPPSGPSSARSTLRPGDPIPGDRQTACLSPSHRGRGRRGGRLRAPPCSGCSSSSAWVRLRLGF